MTAETGPGYADMLTVAEAQQGGSSDEDVFVACNCSNEHPGRPSTKELGCGQEEYVRGPTFADAIAVGGGGSPDGS